MRVLLADGRVGVLVPTVRARHSPDRGVFVVRVGHEGLHLSRESFELEHKEASDE